MAKRGVKTPLRPPSLCPTLTTGRVFHVDSASTIAAADPRRRCVLRYSVREGGGGGESPRSFDAFGTVFEVADPPHSLPYPTPTQVDVRRTAL